MGIYAKTDQMQNDCMVWQSCDNASLITYIYRGISGRWVISNQIGSTKGSICSAETDSISVSDVSNWWYMKNGPKEDDSLTVQLCNLCKIILDLQL